MTNKPLEDILRLWNNQHNQDYFTKEEIKDLLIKATRDKISYDVWLLSMFKAVDEAMFSPQEFDQMHEDYPQEIRSSNYTYNQNLKVAILRRYPQYIGICSKGLSMKQLLSQNDTKTEDFLLEKEKEELINCRWRLLKNVSLKFKDVVGLNCVKEEIRTRIVSPFKHSELAKEYNIKVGGGLLLYGPPGTGKTTIARAVAGEINSYFFYLLREDFFDKTSSEATLKNLEDFFSVLEHFQPSVVFIDEIDVIGPRRDGPKCGLIQQRAINYILQKWDGLCSKFEDNKTYWIGATNLPWELEPAFIRPGRLFPHVYIGCLDLEGLINAFKIGLSDYPIEETINYEVLASRVGGFTVAEIIKSVIPNAADHVFREVINGDEKRPISMEDLVWAIENTQITRDQKYSKKMEQFKGCYLL